MQGQMSIFDYMEPEKKVKWHPIIDELSADVHRLLNMCDIEDENYRVWSHVKNLGKRYECWVFVKDQADVMNVSFAPLIEKYKKKQLEVSFNSSGCLRDSYSHSLMVSSIWITKGHKEP